MQKSYLKSYYTNKNRGNITIGRAAKTFLDFKIDFKDKDTVTSQTVFNYGSEKQRIFFVAEGTPARVIGAVLDEVDSKYHQDIIDHYNTKKLYWMQNNLHDYNKEEFQNELAHGFALDQKAKGRKPPTIFIETKTTKQKLSQPIQKTLLEQYANDPHAFKSAATKEVIDLGIYEHLTPAEMLTQRLTLTGVSVPELAKAVRFDLSTVYNHVKGTRDIDRKAALRYAGFFNCNPADILFPPIKISVTGTVDLLAPSGACEVSIPLESKTVLCPRDFYSGVGGETKAIKINSPNSVYDGHVAYYYYTNKKETDCENKICFIGVDNPFFDDGTPKGLLNNPIDYYIGIYENYRGKTKILNPDPFRNKEIILNDPKIQFIAPIIGMVNIEKVKFSPIQERNIKKLSENEILIKGEKELEIAEEAWFVERAKSNKDQTGKHPGTMKRLETQYKLLCELRRKVQALRMVIHERTINNLLLSDKEIDYIIPDFIKDYKDQKLA